MEAIATLTEESARPGDAGGWEQFVTRFDRRLAGAVRRALVSAGLRADRERVEETAQEVYCRLIEAGPRSRAFGRRDDCEVVGYLRRVARSVVVDQLRGRRAAKRGGDRRRAVADDPEVDLAERIPDQAPSPEERLLTRERRHLFLDRCRRCTGSGENGRRNLRILELALLDGWSSREIAAAAGGGLRASSVDTLVHRLRRRLAAAGLRVPRR
jgi:RNA polymerase sigma factor (sigma-70 family)